MIELHDSLIAALAFLSELFGTLTGFGSSTFFVPLAVQFEPFRFVLVLTAILHCFSNVSKLRLFWQKLDLKILVLLAVPAVVMTVIGALLVEYLPTEFLRKGLGALLVLLAFVFLIGRLRFRRLPFGVSMALAAFSGFTTGAFGTGGAVRAIALASLNVGQSTFIALSAGIDFGGDLFRAGIYIYNGYMDWSQWFYIPVLAVMAYSGTLLGRFLIQYIRKDIFEKVVAVGVGLGGLLLIFE